MSDTRLYLSMMPEALVASMLGPEEFGAYLAVGTQKRSSGEAMFFALKPGFTSERFDLSLVETQCVPHDDGRPKHSLYLGIYRVLEAVPLDAIGNLYLVTRDGRVLELTASATPASFKGRYHLYDEICPVHPLIASTLDPVEFCRFITDPAQPISVPRICFAENDIGALADNPDAEDVALKNWAQIAHIRDCLKELTTDAKHTKTVDRTHVVGGWGRRLKNGFFVGDASGVLFYQYPTPEELEREQRDWWRSAFL